MKNGEQNSNKMKIFTFFVGCVAINFASLYWAPKFSFIELRNVNVDC